MMTNGIICLPLACPHFILLANDMTATQSARFLVLLTGRIMIIYSVEYERKFASPFRKTQYAHLC